MVLLYIKKLFVVLYIIILNFFGEIKILGLIVICDWVLFFKKEKIIVLVIVWFIIFDFDNDFCLILIMFVMLEKFLLFEKNLINC